MYCRECGTLNHENAYTCVQCGGALQQVGMSGARPQEVPTYLAHAILVTLFCCLPFGIPAIVFAAQTAAKWDAGDVRGARAASMQAKRWCQIAFVAGVAPLLLWLLWAIIAMGGAGRHMMQ